MNQGFVNKIIKSILKILGKFKIKTESKEMGTDDTNTQPVIPRIGANTQIIFTIKSFFATLSTILGLFVSFYFLVFIPRADKTEEYQKELYEQQQIYISGEFKAVNNAIKHSNDGIEDLNDRFNDLNKAVGEISNSGGGFGGSTAMGIPAVGETEITLASNDHD